MIADTWTTQNRMLSAAKRRKGIKISRTFKDLSEPYTDWLTYTLSLRVEHRLYTTPSNSVSSAANSIFLSCMRSPLSTVLAGEPCTAELKWKAYYLNDTPHVWQPSHLRKLSSTFSVHVIFSTTYIRLQFATYCNDYFLLGFCIILAPLTNEWSFLQLWNSMEILSITSITYCKLPRPMCQRTRSQKLHWLNMWQIYAVN